MTKEVSGLEEILVNEAIADLSSIQDFIRWGYARFNQAELFYGHGTDNPWDEAVSLVLQTLELPDDTPDAILQSRLTTSEKRELANRIAKRINEKKPLAYITNKAYFCGNEYYVDERVLVPRSPIAELIERHFTPFVLPEKVQSILDLCTGSGCIAIACAQHFPDAIVDGSDISADCLQVAEINRQRFEQDNVAFYQSDLFENIPEKKYDIIVSNPPYVDEEDYDEIPEEFIAEPKLGLVSGFDGLDITRNILSEAKNYLTDGGILIVEVGNSAAALDAAYPEVPFTWLEFERGGLGVFLLTKEQLEEYF
ncbi:50S ribosomal protein L3 N(5)-glutamine methyltransferase [Aliikangiella sp. G2MR2-5]|uniref:50S ribosomal protein L3 N(5)-glutamine methyltransferase n=1 Tax=Aliikangiella sp. G2MR2-5 TaxID=2788943 RepID=UPI0018A8BBCD|nr:50S ribosomal protein L3 N(5)-glutamine methyltransferase [Aliikangiella sp. G2MR2-5]